VSDFTDKVIVGNIMLNPHLIKKFLKKSHYYMVYEPKSEKIAFSANDGNGGDTLLEIRNASYENAVKLARELGLKSDRDTPLYWSKWNPRLYLYHNGTKDAEAVRVELLKSGIPFDVYSGAKTLGLSDYRMITNVPPFELDYLIKEIKDTAKRYKKELKSLP